MFSITVTPAGGFADPVTFSYPVLAGSRAILISPRSRRTGGRRHPADGDDNHKCASLWAGYREDRIRFALLVFGPNRYFGLAPEKNT
jgi:hypothetical protein